MTETVALGRSKRSTAGNRMRELLEKAHQQDEEELFAEVEDDEEFAAPQDVRDVYLDEFADTDDEVERDEEDEERVIRREERRKAKGKSKAYNPLNPQPAPKPKTQPPSKPSVSFHSDLPLHPDLDPKTMAPTTLLLTIRQRARDAKRLHRSEQRRSNLRATTLATETNQTYQPPVSTRKGRVPQHQVYKEKVKMTQAEMIEQALEEEERNKESLRDWVKREEERRELRRVGRKRVKGARWTWVSRTVGRVVEEVGGDGSAGGVVELGGREGAMEGPVGQTGGSEKPNDSLGLSNSKSQENTRPSLGVLPDNAVGPSNSIASIAPLNGSGNPAAGPSRWNDQSPAVQPILASSTVSVLDVETNPAQYTRNYIILSQIPGGLAAELAVILGDHVDYANLQYIPHRNRPINRRPTICPFTGLPARYRHPKTGVPYATIQAYKEIEALLENRYYWSEEGGCWVGCEEDMCAEGVGDLEGWAEAVGAGWTGGVDMREEVDVDADIGQEDAQELQGTARKARGKRRRDSPEGAQEGLESIPKKGRTKR